MADSRGYKHLDEKACRELLGSCHVGRIALSIGALPAIVPVSFLLDTDSVVFQPATSAGLAGLAGAVVAFEAGELEPDGQTGWSVLAIGLSTEIDRPADRRRLALHHRPPWFLDPDNRLFRVPLDLVSGARILPGDPTPSSGRSD